MTKIFGNNVILACILLAMLPLWELKGTIPLAMSQDIWGAAALSNWAAFGWAFLGSTLVVPVLALVFTPIYNWLLKIKFFRVIINFLVGDAAAKSDRIKTENQDKTQIRQFWLKIIAVFVFVAFPVPLTGVWTGTCFAILLGLNFWVTCLTVIAGNAVCGLIVTTICSIFPQATTILMIIFLVLILIAFTIKLILHFRKNKKAAVVADTTEPTVE